MREEQDAAAFGHPEFGGAAGQVMLDDLDLLSCQDDPMCRGRHVGSFEPHLLLDEMIGRRGPRLEHRM